MQLHYKKSTLSKGVQKLKTRAGLALMAISLSISGGSGLALLAVNSANADSVSWNLNGAYTFNFELNGSFYLHDATISGQDNSGNFTISGGYPAGSSTYLDAWKGTGSVSGNTVTIGVNYTAGALGTHMEMTGTIDSTGTISGNWSDNYNGTRNGTWTTVKSSAKQISQILVTPSNPQGWTTNDTQSGGTVNIIPDNSAPGMPHYGALSLVTDSKTSAKAQYMHAADLPLSNVSELSYWTKNNSTSGIADASYQLPVCLGGINLSLPDPCIGFTTFVYEPYENDSVASGTWQNWNVATGRMWSTQTYNQASCSVTDGSGGAPFYTLSELQNSCPHAVVFRFGVNIGTYNPSYNVEADLVDFNGTTYNFEPYVVPTNKNECKNDGWQNLSSSDGKSFKNKGNCVSWVEHDVLNHGMLSNKP